ncbi:MAG: restriction endonuclease, partial [Pirellulaceae bacterium]|nr:restriction endonuclease [Pirellulaceae bacterium]
MDLIDRLKELSSHAHKIVDQLETEEAAKNALVMPLINALGYNVFDPTEVVPEFTADVGIKRGEKVDYAIMREAAPVILFECKGVRADLDKEHASQLYRYFSVTEARFGILTNGIVYRVFSDLDSPNKMDSRPFLEFSLLDITEEVAEQLKKFAKELFNVDNILATASDLKYTKGIKRTLLEEWANPCEEFVRLFASRVYPGRMTQAAKEQFTGIVKRAFHGFVNDRINERLKSALSGEMETKTTSEQPQPPEDGLSKPGDDGIVTTEDELEGFYIVKSIVREVVDVHRVFMRDTKSYCGILLDDNNRKPICRLHFNSAQKAIALFDANKTVIQHKINDVNDIYR